MARCLSIVTSAAAQNTWYPRRRRSEEKDVLIGYQAGATDGEEEYFNTTANVNKAPPQALVYWPGNKTQRIKFLTTSFKRVIG
jgi:hypothetical protein